MLLVSHGKLSYSQVANFYFQEILPQHQSAAPRLSPSYPNLFDDILTLLTSLFHHILATSQILSALKALLTLVGLYPRAGLPLTFRTCQLTKPSRHLLNHLQDHFSTPTSTSQQITYLLLAECRPSTLENGQHLRYKIPDTALHHS